MYIFCPSILSMPWFDHRINLGLLLEPCVGSLLVAFSMKRCFLWSLLYRRRVLVNFSDNFNIICGQISRALFNVYLQTYILDLVQLELTKFTTNSDMNKRKPSQC